MKSQRTKNTLLKTAQANAEAIFLRECFFATQEKIIFKIFPPTKKNLKTPTHSANTNRHSF